MYNQLSEDVYDISDIVVITKQPELLQVVSAMFDEFNKAGALKVCGYRLTCVLRNPRQNQL